MTVISFKPKKPKTKQEYIELLDRAIVMGQTLNAMWDSAFEAISQESTLSNQNTDKAKN